MMHLRGVVVAFLVVISMANLAESHDCAAPVGGRDIGLVLSGGGAKGAYEVGVWKAICEAGLDRRIGAMSGSSVGSLCAVLFSSIREPGKCESVWSAAMTDAFEVNIGSILATALANGPGLEKYANDNGLMSKDALRRVIDANLSVWPSPSPMPMYATTTEAMTLTRSSFRLDTLSKTGMLERVIASCSIPVLYSPQSIDGSRHVDGYLSDNLPVLPIVENDSGNVITTIIVVYLSHDPKKHIAQRDIGARSLVEIIPSENICLRIGNLDLAPIDNCPETARRLIDLGRRDAHKVLNEAGIVKPVMKEVK